MSAIRWTSWLAATQVLCTPVWAQVTQRVSVNSSGHHVYGAYWATAITPDGRYVGFNGDGDGFFPGDNNFQWDGYLRDRQTGITEIVNLTPAGFVGSGASSLTSLSADARFVLFSSTSSTLVPGDTNGRQDAFVRDRQLATTERVSVATSGAQADADCMPAMITPDGRFLVFNSLATTLVPGDTNGVSDAFLRDRQAGTTERVSLSSGGGEGNDSSGASAITPDGRYVLLTSNATNLVPGDTNLRRDVFLRDRQLGTTERVSLTSSGGQGNGDSVSGPISPDARFVLFESQSTNLVPDDTNLQWDVFLRDRQLGTTERVSVSSTGSQGNGESRFGSISADGRYVAFWSYASDLVPDDTNQQADVFLRDRQNGTTERVNVNWAGFPVSNGYVPVMTPDARFVAFSSGSDKLTPEIDLDEEASFLRDRIGGTSFMSTCAPGIGGVVACPCGNPPVFTGFGCDNSAATGGAVLAAMGGAFLSSDSLRFTTNGERATATSILVQGTSIVPSGIVYGQGVRCLGGTTKRLFTRNANGGSITVPDFVSGELQVSVRSAALGAVIATGQTRPYLVVYRDPVVLGGCPATSTFNATQTGLVTWAP